MATHASSASNSVPAHVTTNASGSRLVASPFTSTLNSIVSVKLDRVNYISWRAQLVPAIRGYDLQGYVFGTTPPPPETVQITDENGEQILIPNPELTAWNREDQLLLSWILSTLTPPILSQVVRCRTSHEVWRALETLFSSRSRARIMDLKNQLQSFRKGALTISEYCARMESISDTLLLADACVPEDDLIMSILNGLPAEYDGVINSILSQGNMNVQEVQSLLLSQENRLHRWHTTTIIEVPPSANHAQISHRGLNSEPTPAAAPSTQHPTPAVPLQTQQCHDNHASARPIPAAIMAPIPTVTTSDSSPTAAHSNESLPTVSTAVSNDSTQPTAMANVVPAAGVVSGAPTAATTAAVPSHYRPAAASIHVAYFSSVYSAINTSVL
ncbi:hypothetical protein F8388_023415 [Cannabis sativa]|uniref:Retrotransposon Copia-like N-terminal domain-containing protein n=1 Tax=Cannabis sativa TaxID=3483 RepID=A0A7J6G3C3_CANSA|nr:hypothetical protein G4B88_005826 [Cannabis sativa]KAF4393611.1 hypothetical protein F8388_023415 [Cannabis sativa]